MDLNPFGYKSTRSESCQQKAHSYSAKDKNNPRHRFIERYRHVRGCPSLAGLCVERLSEVLSRVGANPPLEAGNSQHASPPEHDLDVVSRAARVDAETKIDRPRLASTLLFGARKSCEGLPNRDQGQGPRRQDHGRDKTIL